MYIYAFIEHVSMCASIHPCQLGALANLMNSAYYFSHIVIFSRDNIVVIMILDYQYIILVRPAQNALTYYSFAFNIKQ